tara:strand:+ start:115 stop:519 length:405 start_codon:yes stop_codon:yes gene_type:complete
MAFDFETIKQLNGKTLTKVDASDENIWFYTTDNKAVRLWHQQDCCESVYVEDIVGDVSDLVGSPILRAEVRTEDGEADYGDLLYTFYELATINGSVTIRWNGSSNGYYSVRVSLSEYNVDEEGDVVWSSQKIDW